LKTFTIFKSSKRKYGVISEIWEQTRDEGKFFPFYEELDG